LVRVCDTSAGNASVSEDSPAGLSVRFGAPTAVGAASENQRGRNGVYQGPSSARRLPEHLARRLGEGRPIDPLLALGVGAQQRPITQRVNESRHAVAEAVKLAHERVGKQLPPGARHFEAMSHIGRDLRLAQGSQVIARNDALCHLPQFGTGQHVRQFRLTQQDDLQQLALVGFEIGEQAHLLQNLRREVLRLVDDQYRMPPPGVGIE
jgi:hypothetical protein